MTAHLQRGVLGVVIVLVAACSSPASNAPLGVSCQPVGASAAPIQLPFGPGPVTSATAEQTAVALFRACAHGSALITNLTSGSVSATGMTIGPNAGDPVWLVQVDATITEPAPGSAYQSHVLIEVNQATGRPTIVGQG